MRTLSYFIAASMLIGCGTGSGGTFEPGAADDPVIKRAQELGAPDPCGNTFLHGDAVLFHDDFASPANDLGWPGTAGYDGDFNAEWFTDGVTARPINPTAPGANPASPPLPIVTGFVKFIDFCAVPGARISVTAHAITNLLTDNTSDATVVLYVFDEQGGLIEIKTSSTLYHNNDKDLEISDYALPAKARRVAVVPMSRLGPAETNATHYDSLHVEYSSTVMTADVTVNDDFTNTTTNSFGSRQPVGWSDYGADWFSHPSLDWMTVSNPVWNGGQAGLEVGAYRDIPLTGITGTSVLRARIFASATFSDPSSFSLLRLTFSDGSVLDSPRLQGWSYDTLALHNVTIPGGVTSVRAQVVAVLGPTEPSSLYMDNFVLAVERPSLNLIAAKTYAPSSAWFDASADVGVASRFTVPAEIPIDTATYAGALSPFSLAAGNAGNHSTNLNFTKADGSVVQCIYRGGASVAHPGTNPNQLALARRYVFSSCSDGTTAGGTVTARGVLLRINNGDSFMPSTRVALSLTYER